MQEARKRIVSWLTSFSGIGWIAYFSSLVAYIVFFLDKLKIEIAAPLFTIGLMVLAVLENNRSIQNATKRQLEATQESTRQQIQTLREITERQLQAIQESTRQQIQCFVEQCGAIVERLEKVVGILSTMSEESRKKIEAEERKARTEEERLRRELFEKEAEKERIKPKIFVRIEEGSYFLLWRHYWIHIANVGGDSGNLELTHRFIHRPYAGTTARSQYFENIPRKRTESIDVGNVDNYRPYLELHLHISVRDVQQRKYEGELYADKNNREWIELSLQEIPGA